MNVAVRVDGRRPLGARALRMSQQLELVLETWDKDLGPVEPSHSAVVCRIMIRQARPQLC